MKLETSLAQLVYRNTWLEQSSRSHTSKRAEAPDRRSLRRGVAFHGGAGLFFLGVEPGDLKDYVILAPAAHTSTFRFFELLGVKPGDLKDYVILAPAAHTSTFRFFELLGVKPRDLKN